jgi:hypothetical protein
LLGARLALRLALAKERLRIVRPFPARGFPGDGFDILQETHAAILNMTLQTFRRAPVFHFGGHRTLRPSLAKPRSAQAADQKGSQSRPSVESALTESARRAALGFAAQRDSAADGA